MSILKDMKTNSVYEESVEGEEIIVLNLNFLLNIIIVQIYF